MSHSIEEQETISPEAAILGEIKEAEKKAEEILEKARLGKESIIQEARSSSSKLLLSKDEEIRKSKEKRIMDFREKARLLSEEKLAEGRLSAKQAKSKSEKNMQKAVDFVLKKFDEMI